MTALHETLAKSHQKLERGRVWCRTCGHTQRVDSAHAMRAGWPKCCGYTMTIDAPDERANAPSNAELSGVRQHVRLGAVLDAGDCGQRCGWRSRNADALDSPTAALLRIAERWPKRTQTLRQLRAFPLRENRPKLL